MLSVLEHLVGIYITLLGSAFWVLVKETGRHSRRTSALVSQIRLPTRVVSISPQTGLSVDDYRNVHSGHIASR